MTTMNHRKHTPWTKQQHLVSILDSFLIQLLTASTDMYQFNINSIRYRFNYTILKHIATKNTHSTLDVIVLSTVHEQTTRKRRFTGHRKRTYQSTRIPPFNAAYNPFLPLFLSFLFIVQNGIEDKCEHQQ